MTTENSTLEITEINWKLISKNENWDTENNVTTLAHGEYISEIPYRKGHLVKYEYENKNGLQHCQVIYIPKSSK